MHLGFTRAKMVSTNSIPAGAVYKLFLRSLCFGIVTQYHNSSYSDSCSLCRVDDSFFGHSRFSQQESFSNSGWITQED